MVEEIIVLRNGKPLMFFYGMFESGHEDIELFEEQLMFIMTKYTPLNPEIVWRFPCDNSEDVLNAVRAKLRAEPGTVYHGSWFKVDFNKIRILINDTIREVNAQ